MTSRRRRRSRRTSALAPVIAFVDSNELAGQHAVRLPGHHRPGLERSTRSSASTSMAATTARPIRSIGGNSLDQQQLQRHAGPAAQVRRCGVAPPPPPPPVQPAPRRSWCSSTGTARTCRQQALTTIQQAANAYKTKGNARITATGHTDTSGPESLQHGAVAASREHGQGRAGA